MELVYICSPYKPYGNVSAADNLEKAKKYCKMASDKGYIPICPHLYFSQFLNDDCEKERSTGMVMGEKLLRYCNVIWVFGDHISAGMASEIESASWNKIQIKFFNEECERRE